MASIVPSFRRLHVADQGMISALEHLKATQLPCLPKNVVSRGRVVGPLGQVHGVTRPEDVSSPRANSGIKLHSVHVCLPVAAVTSLICVVLCPGEGGIAMQSNWDCTALYIALHCILQSCAVSNP
jgi:hypothetical protein